ncbi:MAG: hypothetical protein WCQ26_01545 [Pseudanabaena sp. ELA748]
MVKRPDNDQHANELIRQISLTTYEYFRAGGTLPANNNSANPVNSSTPTNSTDTTNPPNVNNRGTSMIENIPLPLPKMHHLADLHQLRQQHYQLPQK